MSAMQAQQSETVATASSMQSHRREIIRLSEANQPTLVLQVQRPQDATSSGDVIYVHGSTFGADLSVFWSLDGRSWADEMNDIGMTVWGFDFAGYGSSDRYTQDNEHRVGRMDKVVEQLQRVVAAVRERIGGRAVTLVSHSWGASVAARFAGLHPRDVKALVFFAPIVERSVATQRPTSYVPSTSANASSHYPLSLWAQYRRFVEDVPRGHPQVFGEAHFDAWGAAFLATDSNATTRVPPSVMTPAGPQADVLALWSGQALFDPALIVAPTLLVRGDWDSVCSDFDAKHLLHALGSADKTEIRIDGATHLMHLESQRGLLYNAVNMFLQRTAT